MVPNTKLNRKGEVLVDQPTAAPERKVKAGGLAGVALTVVSAVLAVFDTGVDTQALYAAAIVAVGSFIAAYRARSKAK